MSAAEASFVITSSRPRGGAFCVTSMQPPARDGGWELGRGRAGVGLGALAPQSPSSAAGGAGKPIQPGTTAGNLLEGFGAGG